MLFSVETDPKEKGQILENDFSIKMTQSIESEVSLMCNLSKGVREEGIQQGRKETLVESITNLMRNMKLTCDQAMDALGIPEADKAWYAKKLGKN